MKLGEGSRTPVTDRHGSSVKGEVPPFPLRNFRKLFGKITFVEAWEGGTPKRKVSVTGVLEPSPNLKCVTTELQRPRETELRSIEVTNIAVTGVGRDAPLIMTQTLFTVKTF